jgi:hypothetical protein
MTTSQRIRPVGKTRVVPVDPVRAFELVVVELTAFGGEQASRVEPR